jgi:membrane protease YdiL (CAAX protease family)
MPKPVLLQNICDWLSTTLGNLVVSTLGALITNALPLSHAPMVSNLTKVPTNIIDGWWILTLLVALFVSLSTLQSLFGRWRSRSSRLTMSRYGLLALLVAVLASHLLPDKPGYIFGATIDEIIMVTLLQLFAGSIATLLSVAAYSALTACTAETDKGAEPGR